MPKTLAIGAAAALLVYLLACAVLFLLQRSFIYYPTGRGVRTPAITLPNGQVDLVVSTNGRKHGPAVLYFGGNAEDVSQAIAPLSRVFPAAAIYALHYRGYGGSGGSPSERALVGDGKAVFDLIRQSHPQIRIIGRSLGSGVAIQVAASRPATQLTLITPFYSIAELAAQHFRWFPVRLLLRGKYESWRHAGALNIPTALVVAEQDEIIPMQHALKLAAAFPDGAAKLIVIAAAGHNNISDQPAYAAAISHGKTASAP